MANAVKTPSQNNLMTEGSIVKSLLLFALPLMAGIICGTYSSVCLTGALWYVLTTRKGKKAAEKSGK